MRRPTQLESNLESADLVLAEAELAELNAVSAPGPPPYPYSMVEEFYDVPHWRTLETR